MSEIKTHLVEAVTLFLYSIDESQISLLKLNFNLDFDLYPNPGYLQMNSTGVSLGKKLNEKYSQLLNDIVSKVIINDLKNKDSWEVLILFEQLEFSIEYPNIVYNNSPFQIVEGKRKPRGIFYLEKHFYIDVEKDIREIPFTKLLSRINKYRAVLNEL